MGLTNNSVGIKAVDSGLVIKKQSQNDKVIALAGNPNVGKSTIFNGLTGLKQHTGNWPGKTVTNAQGYYASHQQSYVMVDIPGTYSLMAHSQEEEVARNFICFGHPDAVVVVCVNLMDEAMRKNIEINLPLLSKRLGVPVVGTSARKKKSLAALMQAVNTVVCETNATQQYHTTQQYKVKYADILETAIGLLAPTINALLKTNCKDTLNSRWLALKLLDQDESLIAEINRYLGEPFLSNPALQDCLKNANNQLKKDGITGNKLKDLIVSALVKSAEEICNGAVTYHNHKYAAIDRKIDTVLTSKATGYPVMLGLLMLVFWLTITGANYPSQLLADGLFWVQDRLTDCFIAIHAPDWLHGILVLGVYRVLA